MIWQAVILLVIAAGGVLYLRKAKAEPEAVVQLRQKRKAIRENKPAKVTTKRTGHRYLVVGGSGMLGSHIVEALLARGETDVHVFDRVVSPLWKDDKRVTQIQGDILSLKDVTTACMGRETVICTAALINYYSDLQWDAAPSYLVNVTGSCNVVEACKAEKVKRLLYTSSDTVCTSFNKAKGVIEVTGHDEKAPYGIEFSSHYIPTKIAAERAVLAANGKSGLAVTVLRPSGMWGPRDRLMTEQFLEPVSHGIGAIDAMQDFAYVENVVHGFLCAERSLLEPEMRAAGQCYNVGNGFFISYGEFNERLAKSMKCKFQLIPPAVVNIMAHVSRLITMVLKDKYTHELRLVTPQTLAIARATFEFSCDKARRELGWEAPYTMDEALEQNAKYYMI